MDVDELDGSCPHWKSAAGGGRDEMAQSSQLGPKTYRLLVSAAYKPDAYKRHKVEVRGFLIRRPTESRLNITSLETLDPSCGE